MNYQTENALERLVALMDEQGIQGIEQWQAERKQATDDATARAKQAALDSVVYINRIEIAQQRGAGDRVTDVVRPLERFAIRRGDLLAFSTKYGLNYNDLLAVVELRKQEVSSHGKTFRSGSGQYVDNSAREKARRKEMEQDQRELEAVGARNKAVAAIPFAYPLPQVTDWNK
jgi:hypothetical protein